MNGTNRSIASIAVAVFLTAFLWVSNASAEKHPPTAEDSVMLKRPLDAQISPDGKWIAFHYNEPQLKTGTRNSDIWIVPSVGGEPRKLTNGDKSDYHARWSPDGKSIAFLSNRGESGKTQLYLIPIDGGEALPLTNEKEFVSDHSWSPDGKRIAFLMTDPPTEEEENRIRNKEDQQLYDADFKYARLYTVDVSSRTVVKVTEGPINVWGYNWSPDGKNFVIACSNTPRIDESYVRARLEIVPSTGGQGIKLVEPSGKFPGKLRQPVWSPDGETIAYLASGNDGREPYAGRIWIISAKGGAAKNISENQPRTYVNIGWMPKGGKIIANAIEGVHNAILSVSPADGATAPLISANERSTLRGADNVNVSVSADGGLIAMVKEDANRPPDVWLKNLNADTLTQITKLNPQSDEWEWGSAEAIRWKASDGLEIEGILVKPAGYQPGKRYPLLVNVHGGPESADQIAFHLSYSDWAYLMSARGYAVLLPNYRGSIGRGAAYAMGDIGDMGGKEFTDIMAGIDALIERGIADPDRLGIGGWSYGGYMTAWSVTQTDRFKIGIMGAGISNWVSFMSQTDIPYENAEAHWGHALFSDQKKYAERSPVEHAAKAKTPVLILHGGSDPRVPLPQGVEFYSRLRFQGVAASLAIYPREGHGLTEPAHQLDAMKRMFEWVDKYLK